MSMLLRDSLEMTPSSLNVYLYILRGNYEEGEQGVLFQQASISQKMKGEKKLMFAKQHMSQLLTYCDFSRREQAASSNYKTLICFSVNSSTVHHIELVRELLSRLYISPWR